MASPSGASCLRLRLEAGFDSIRPTCAPGFPLIVVRLSVLSLISTKPASRSEEEALHERTTRAKKGSRDRHGARFLVRGHQMEGSGRKRDTRAKGITHPNQAFRRGVRAAG